MATDRQILEMNVRLIDIIQVYHQGESTPKTRALMVAEIRSVARWFTDARLGESDIEKRVLKPVAEELCRRYGPQEGARFYADFVQAFRGMPASPSLTHSVKA